MSTTTPGDDGPDADDPETVRIATTAGYGIDVFHDDETCRRWPAEGRDITRADAARRGLRQCRWCSGDAVAEGAPSNKYLKRLGVGVND